MGIEEHRRMGKGIEGRFTRKLKYDMISVNYDSTVLPIDASNAKKILKTLSKPGKSNFSKFSKKISTSPSLRECHLSDTEFDDRSAIFFTGYI